MPLFNVDTDSDDDIRIEEPPAKRTKLPRKGENENESDSEIEIESAIIEPKKTAQWETKFLGGECLILWGERYAIPSYELTIVTDLVVSAYTTYRSSTFCSLRPNESVSLHRIAPASTSKSSKVQDSIVRFKNSKGVEVGRIMEAQGEFSAISATASFD